MTSALGTPRRSGVPSLRLGVAAPRWAPPWWVWIGVTIALYTVSRLGIAFTPPGGAIAAWWPAAGIAAWFLLVNPPRRRVGAMALVLVVTALANAAGGRDIVTSLLFGLANAIEAGLFAQIVDGGRDRRFLLRSVRHSWRFALAAFTAAAALSVIVGSTVGFTGGDGVETALHAFASHAAAILMIAPFAALPPNIMQRLPWAEMIAQATVLTGILVFLATTGPSLPLTFLPVGVLAWGAYRFPIRGAYTESLIAGVAVLAMTVAGLGPFSSPDLTPQAQTTLVVVYLLMNASYTLFLSTASYEVRDANRVSRTFSELFRGGFLDSRVGLLIAQRDERAWHVLLSNTAAEESLGAELDEKRRWIPGPVRTRVETSLRTEGISTFETPDGRVMNVDASPVSDDPTQVAVQIFDITGSLRATQAQLSVERERAKTLAERLELDRRQEDFVATASHELRTPITSISGYLELLEDDPDLSAQSREWLGVVGRNTARLSELVEDLLALSHATDRPEQSDRIETATSSELIAEVVAILTPLAADKGITVAVGDTIGEVVGMRGEIARALGNLASNAVKFTPPGGRVRIEAVPHVSGDPFAAPATRFTVTDTGPGIAPGALDQVFERFYRAPEAERESTPGTGLGLAITRELARRNGGSVELTSLPGEGLIATLVIPAP